jgi:hypothetical protein
MNSKDYAERMLNCIEGAGDKQPRRKSVVPSASPVRENITRSPRRMSQSAPSQFRSPKHYVAEAVNEGASAADALARGSVTAAVTHRQVSKVIREEVKLDAILISESDTVFDLGLDGVPLGEIVSPPKSAQGVARTSMATDLSSKLSGTKSPKSARQYVGRNRDTGLTQVVDKRKPSSRPSVLGTPIDISAPPTRSFKGPVVKLKDLSVNADTVERRALSSEKKRRPLQMAEPPKVYSPPVGEGMKGIIEGTASGDTPLNAAPSRSSCEAAAETNVVEISESRSSSSIRADATKFMSPKSLSEAPASSIVRRSVTPMTMLADLSVRSASPGHASLGLTAESLSVPRTVTAEFTAPRKIVSASHHAQKSKDLSVDVGAGAAERRHRRDSLSSSNSKPPDGKTASLHSMESGTQRSEAPDFFGSAF